MKTFLRIRIFCLVACWLSAVQAAGLRPNFVFLLADDLRRAGLGCYGDPLVRTPPIDRLAAEGVRFTNHFVTTSLCKVSRASIFSGQHARRHGITDGATPFTAEEWEGTYPALVGINGAADGGASGPRTGKPGATRGVSSGVERGSEVDFTEGNEGNEERG